MSRRFEKPISAFILFILFFNLGGQLLVHRYLVFKSDCFFDRQISRGLYNVNDLTEIKIPANLPGIANQKDYIRTFGEVKFKNESYNYVKIKLTRTAIYLLCVPNYETTRLSGVNIIHAENITDIPAPKKEHVPFNKSLVLAQFNFVFQKFRFSVPAKCAPALLAENDNKQADYSMDIPQPPPKLSIALHV